MCGKGAAAASNVWSSVARAQASLILMHAWHAGRSKVVPVAARRWARQVRWQQQAASAGADASSHDPQGATPGIFICTLPPTHPQFQGLQRGTGCER